MKKCFLLLILCSLSDISFGQFTASLAIDSLFAAWNKPNVPGCALGNLKMRIGDHPSTMVCTIDAIDQFALKLGLVRFQRTNNLISGFELDEARVKNLKFEKK